MHVDMVVFVYVCVRASAKYVLLNGFSSTTLSFRINTTRRFHWIRLLEAVQESTYSIVNYVYMHNLKTETQQQQQQQQCFRTR